MSQALDRWQESGVTRIIDFRELAAAIGRRLHVSETQKDLLLKVTSEDAPPLVKPLLVSIRSNSLPSRVSVEIDGRKLALPVHPCDDGEGLVELPCAESTTGPHLENFQS